MCTIFIFAAPFWGDWALVLELESLSFIVWLDFRISSELMSYSSNIFFLPLLLRKVKRTGDLDLYLETIYSVEPMILGILRLISFCPKYVSYVIATNLYVDSLQ